MYYQVVFLEFFMRITCFEYNGIKLFRFIDFGFTKFLLSYNLFARRFIG